MRLIESARTTTEIAAAISNNDLVFWKDFLGSDDCASALTESETIDLPWYDTPNYQKGLDFRSTYDGGKPIGYVRLYGGPKSGLLKKVYDAMVAVAKPVRDVLAQDDGQHQCFHHLEIFTYQPGISFVRHTHDLRPSMIGLILLLSQPNQGGTVFYADDGIIDSSAFMSTGDLLIFPWGMEHEVTAAVEQKRVVALLPYY